jgi:hypothetical protein
MTIVSIGGGHRLESGAAASWRRTVAAGNPGGITSSLRSTEEQREQYAMYLAGTGNFALPPGTSIHETGRALDVYRAAATWLYRHPDYGWRRPKGWNATGVKNPEWWHWEYIAALDKHKGDRMAALTPIQLEDEEMMFITGDKTKTVYAVSLVTGACDALGKDAYDGLALTPGFALTKMTQEQCDAIREKCAAIRTQLATNVNLDSVNVSVDDAPVIAAIKAIPGDIVAAYIAWLKR